jgi:CheY-like chemotaxis protein
MISKQTIFLVVDDMEPMRKVTENQLRSMGASSIVMAGNGAEAMRMLKSKRVDIILSDWNMPVMTGLELLKAVRADAKLAHLPFIMITAEAERYRIEEAIAAGISDLLVKPYTAICLAERIAKALVALSRPTPPVSATVAAVPVAVAASTKIAAVTTSAEPKIQTLLIVDDTPDNLELLAHLFKDEYRVRIAQNGDKALGICQSDDPPDLVLLDIMMPGMDGFEVARRMREHPMSESIPVIFVTAMTGADERLKGFELGAVDFVTKPVDPAVLQLRVRNFMRYVNLRKQMQANYDAMLELAHLRESVEHITRHDMKGSLAGVIGLVQTLAFDTTLSNGQLGQLHMAEETALEVLNMINLSSELFKIETGRFELDAKPVKIGNILKRIVEISHTTFAEKHLNIAVYSNLPSGEEQPQMLGDEMLCYSLFQNLIKNACEAAPENSRVSVTLNDETPLRIAIQNKGVVPAEIRDRFFGKFVTHGKSGGTGLGAYSAKMLTEAQNGTIAMDVSDPENQTTITVTMPRNAKPH